MGEGVRIETPEVPNGVGCGEQVSLGYPTGERIWVCNVTLVYAAQDSSIFLVRR